MADTSFCPDLSRLSLQTGLYPESSKPWVERDDLVLGGCKAGNPLETLCYDEWSLAFVRRILENPLANTIVLLSVGAGVHELQTLQLLQQMSGDATNESFMDSRRHMPITRVWLIDPGLDRATGDQVSAQFEAVLSDKAQVRVEYFVGNEAYKGATARLRTLEPLDVAAIGALNVSFGMMGPTLQSMRPHLEACKFIERTHDHNNKNVHVVTAYYNRGAPPVVRDEPAQSFLTRHLLFLANEMDQTSFCPDLSCLSLQTGASPDALDEAVDKENAAIHELEEMRRKNQELMDTLSMHRNLYRSPYSRDWKRQKEYADDAQKRLDAGWAKVPGLKAEVEAAKEATNKALKDLKAVDPGVARARKEPILEAREAREARARAAVKEERWARYLKQLAADR